MKIVRIRRNSSQIKCHNLLAPFAVGVQENNRWVIAFHRTIEYSFVGCEIDNSWKSAQ